jgi:cytochrome c oxidase subunit 3
MASVIATDHGFQYSSATHQSHTAVAGMWLFLATEVLFFGSLFLGWIYARHANMEGFDLGARQTDLAIGTVNSVILISSSLAYSLAVVCIKAGNVRLMVRWCALAGLLGLAFLLLKFGLEWHSDFDKRLFPNAAFAIHGPLRGPAQLFFSFYFVATALHGLHMLVGLGLLAWIIHRARRGDFGAKYWTPVAVIGLYWSFVDIVWMILYPLIYLIGRGS